MNTSFIKIVILLGLFSFSLADELHLSNDKVIECKLVGIDEVRETILLVIDNDSLQEYNLIDVQYIKNEEGVIVYQSRYFRHTGERMIFFGSWTAFIYTFMHFIFGILNFS